MFGPMKKIEEQGMLTKTYTTVALSHEQKNARQVLSKLTATLQEAKRASADARSAASALRQFADANRFYQGRALEQHVIPAIRASIAEANTLLAELEVLAAGSERILQRANEQLQGGRPPAEQSVFSAMEQYCSHLTERLGKEESELIPLAFRSLTPEEWFAIAVKCLPEEDRYGKKAA